MPRYAISERQWPIIMRDLKTLEEWPLTTTLESILAQEVISLGERVEQLEKEVKHIRKRNEENTNDRPEDQDEIQRPSA